MTVDSIYSGLAVTIYASAGLDPATGDYTYNTDGSAFSFDHLFGILNFNDTINESLFASEKGTFKILKSGSTCEFSYSGMSTDSSQISMYYHGHALRFDESDPSMIGINNKVSMAPSAISK